MLAVHKTKFNKNVTISSWRLRRRPAAAISPISPLLRYYRLPVATVDQTRAQPVTSMIYKITVTRNLYALHLDMASILQLRVNFQFITSNGYKFNRPIYIKKSLSVFITISWMPWSNIDISFNTKAGGMQLLVLVMTLPAASILRY